MSSRIRKIDGLDELIRKWQKTYEVDDGDYRTNPGDASLWVMFNLGPYKDNPGYVSVSTTRDLEEVGLRIGVYVGGYQDSPATYIAALQRLQENRTALVALGYAVPEKLDFEEQRYYEQLEYHWRVHAENAIGVDRILQQFSTLSV